jgi:hypothetical protein
MGNEQYIQHGLWNKKIDEYRKRGHLEEVNVSEMRRKWVMKMWTGSK